MGTKREPHIRSNLNDWHSNTPKNIRILREDFYPLRSLSLTIIHCHAASEICVSYHLSSGAGQHIQLPTHTKTRKIHNNVHWSVTHSSNAYLQWQVSSQSQVNYPSGSDQLLSKCSQTVILWSVARPPSLPNNQLEPRIYMKLLIFKLASRKLACVW